MPKCDLAAFPPPHDEDDTPEPPEVVQARVRLIGRIEAWERDHRRYTEYLEPAHTALADFLDRRGYTVAPVTLDSDEWVFAAWTRREWPRLFRQCRVSPGRRPKLRWPNPGYRPPCRE